MNTISSVIVDAKYELFYNGSISPSNKWQGVKAIDKIIDIRDRFYRMEIPQTIKSLSEQTNADLPWAEDHFLERINGQPLNPGEQYKNWPYYKGIDNDQLFRNEDGFKFSHTYMERFWPSGDGLRYKNGDFNDLLNRIKEDPYGRQSFFSIWHPEDQSLGDRRLPCSIGYFFQIKGYQMDITYLIRSCDIFRHFHNDIYLTGRLLQYVVEKTREILPFLSCGVLSMWIGNLHCFISEKEKLLWGS